MKPSVTVSMQEVQAVEAAEWLRQYHYARQRGIRPYHVQFLAHLMKQGRFRQGTAIDFGVFNGRKYLLNGQHTLDAVAKVGQSCWLSIFEHAVTSEEGLAQLYASFDRQLIRSAADMIRAYGFADAYGFGAEHTTRFHAALRLLLSGFAYTMPGSDPARFWLKDEVLMYAALCEWAPEARLFLDDIAGTTQRITLRLLRQGIFAVALATYRFAPHQAHAFWRAVAHDTGSLEAGDASKHLLLWCMDRTSTDRSPWGVARYAAPAWNSFMKQVPIKNLHPQAASTPLTLEGTPHKGAHALRYLSETWEVLREPVPHPPLLKKTAIAKVLV